MRPRLRAAIAEARAVEPDDAAGTVALLELLEALEDEPQGNAIREDLTVAAAVASELARENTLAGHPVVAAEWSKVARDALEALRYAPPPEHEGDDVVAVTEEQAEQLERVGEYLEQIETAGDFLSQMHGEFRSAPSPVADRWAARIAATLEQMPDYAPTAPQGMEDHER